ncbi:uncharacterized protein [Asterias amurensis]|uniref:uncharacterized protein n=1 Tax=Asterias amurensis TaxID=7602 RepID=UPI003AB90236
MSTSFTRKREAVFTAHVLTRLFPSAESEQGEPLLQQLPSKDSFKKSLQTKIPSGPAKIYTAELPPDGLPPPETLDSSSVPTVRPSASSESLDSSSETEDEEALPRKRRRKRKRKRKALQINDDVETITSSSGNIDDPSPPNGTSGESQTQKLRDSEIHSSPQEAVTQTLTKNQRKKRRKRRAKKGKPLPQQLHRATEFICDDGGEEEADSNGDEELDGVACEVKEFMESVWRVYCCDGTKRKDVPCQTEPFHAMIGQLSTNQLPGEILTQLIDIKKFLVLQDFTRAELKLTELKEKSRSTAKSENVSMFSTLAEYWMNDIHTTALR